MTTGPKSKHGGVRAGSGRPLSATVTERQVRKLLDDAESEEKRTGESIGMILQRHIRSDDARESLAAIRLFFDKAIAPIAEGGPADKFLAGDDGLPGKRSAPAEVVPIKE